jgi:hypothetical protein
MLYNLQRIREHFINLLKKDRLANARLVVYEWHFGEQAINAFDSPALYDEWKAQAQNAGFEKARETEIVIDGFTIRRISYVHPTKTFYGIDPLAAALGYIKGSQEWVVFEVDHSR